MELSRQQRIIRVMSGQDRSVSAAMSRGLLAIAEPFYRSAVGLRNTMYDVGLFKSHKLARPVISVGNITTGGTGKTPMVRWLASRLIDERLRPAVLMRGYGDDEHRLLADALADEGDVIASRNRVAGAIQALSAALQPDVFILDDGFQHRRAKRDFNIVLISATNPFGFDHVLPRGLLREPLPGLQRADAIVITRSNQIDPSLIGAIENRIRHYTVAPIFRASHTLTSLRTTKGLHAPMSKLLDQRYFVFCGIADPASLLKQLPRHSDTFAGERIFDDHHAYTTDDLTSLARAMAEANAELLVTTEKDWVKLDPAAREALPILRLELEMEFHDSGKLWELLKQRLNLPASSPAKPA